MKSYEVVVIGGSIAGSIAGRYLANAGISTLIVEAAKTPREKPCSGIQFKYFERLVGTKIPKERLCQNELRKLYIEYPDGKAYKVPFKMLNFTRDVFDSWLNELAIEAGAEFRDGVRCMGYEINEEGFIINLRSKNNYVEQVFANFLIAADGLMSSLRRKLRPQDFSKKFFSPTMNYYLRTKDDGDLDPHTLYQFWNLDFNNMMFAWVYKKNDLWVIGTGHSDGAVKHCDMLMDYVINKFNLQGEVVKKEGFASTFMLKEPHHVFLGNNNQFFIGDAAGLVEMYRGLGMDAAALSGRLVAKAIIKGKKTGISPNELYKKYMKKLVDNIDNNSVKQLLNFENNDELQQFLKKSSIKMALATIIYGVFNKLSPFYKMKLLPA